LATLRKLCGAPHKFRIGDFYEVFDEDAETLHKALGLTLTTRDQTVSMAGFPHHQLEAYLHKLLNAEFRVAICDQVEDCIARTRREVQRVIVPDEDGDGGEGPA
jgi:DNA mismatch repair protein MutS